MLVIGEVYRRRDLHELFGGQRQGGISTPANQAFIMLFTGDQGEHYGYEAGWSEEGYYLYTGVGQRGDMSFERGNSAILEHAADGKDIHLFENDGNGYVRYVGEMVCTGYREVRGPDIDGNTRRVIVFELTTARDLDDGMESLEEYEQMWKEPLGKLRKRATASYASKKTAEERRALAETKSKALRVYVLKRAKGVCEACGRHSLFRTSSGRPYLEPHHIRRTCDGGPDDPRWVIGLCPSCHRRVHYSADKTEFNSQLDRVVEKKERRVEKKQKRRKGEWNGEDRRSGVERRSGRDQRSGEDRRG